jgi:hypothetical protein
MAEPSVQYHRFEGFSLSDKHSWTRQGPGPAELEKTRSALAGLGGDLVAAEQALRDAVGKLGAEWEGGAAEQAGAQMVVAAAWAGDSGGMTSQAGSTVEQQASAVGDTRAKVPQPPDMSYGLGDALQDAGRTFFDAQTFGVFGVQTDAQRKVEAYRQADATANSALYAYESSSRAHVDAMPPLPQPPPIAVSAADGTAPPPVHGGTARSPIAGGGGSTATQGTDFPDPRAGQGPRPGVQQPTGGGSTSTSDAGPPPPPPAPAPPGRDDRGRDPRSHGADLIAGGLGLGAGVLAGGATLSDGMRGGGRGIAGGSLGELLGDDGGHAGGRATAGRGAGSGLGPLNEEEAEARATRAAVGGKGSGAPGPGLAGGAARGRGEENGEHTDRYAVVSDVYYVDDTPRVAPPVIGEDA